MSAWTERIFCFMKKSNNYNLIGGAVICGLMLLLILIGQFYTPHDPNAIDGMNKLAAPSPAHLLGTDNLGRDIFSRVLVSLGTTFSIALCTVCIGAAAGVLIGGLTGYFGGPLDEILMRACDIVAAFPSILLALVFISLIGPGKYNVIITLGILFIPSFARITRSAFAGCKNQDYIKSARLMGAGGARLMLVHILPNTIPTLASAIAIGFNNAVLAEASMSYLGIGVQPPDASLGRMLSEAQSYLFKNPWYALSAGIPIVLLILGFSLLGDGLQRRGGSDASN